MIAVRFHREAEQELLEAELWYRERNEVAARSFALEIDHAILAICEAHLRWALGTRGERRFVLDHFPYTIMYRVKADHAFITAVAHQSRRPGYWHHRR